MQLHFYQTESPRVLLSCSCISTRQNPWGFCYHAAAFPPDRIPQGFVIMQLHFYQTKSFRILLPCSCISTRLNLRVTAFLPDMFFLPVEIIQDSVTMPLHFYQTEFSLLRRIFFISSFFIHLFFILVYSFLIQFIWYTFAFYMWLVVISVFFKLVVRNILKYSLWVQGWKTAIAIFLDPPATLFVALI